MTYEIKSFFNHVLSSTDETWGETRVCQAIQQGLDVSVIHHALEDEPWTVNERNALGDAPLHLALYLLGDATEVVELLIAMGADVHLRGRWDRTPLMIAAGQGNLECIRTISRFKGTLEAKDPWGNTALHRATFFNQSEAVQLLLASGSQATARNLDGNTPLHFLRGTRTREEQPTQEILRLLLKDQSVGVDTRDFFGRTPVVSAAINHRLQVVRLLVGEGASLHTIDSQGLTLLHHAASRLSLQVLQYLDGLGLSGIDVNHPDCDGWTPWDMFQLVMLAPLSSLGASRRPSVDEQHAFVSLYEGIRNRTAEHDMTRLGAVLHALSRRDATAAFSLLQDLIEKKQKWASGLDKWYRILARQIKEGGLDAATASIEDYIEELRELVQSSVWDLPSIWTPRPEPEEDQDLETEHGISEGDVGSGRL